MKYSPRETILWVTTQTLKPMAKITLNSERLFLPKIRSKVRMSLSSPLFNIAVKGFAIAIRQQK